jgi:DNA gyrase subunit A
LRLAIELQRGAEPNPVLAQLFKLTPLQDTFSIIMLALVDNEPRVLNIKQCLKVYLDHRQEVIRRRSEFDLARARERAHILEGLLKALENIDETIAIIRKSQNADTARTNLMKALHITEIQAQAILDMQLRRLAALERRKIEDEHKEKVKLIRYLESLLQSPQKMREVVAEELSTIKQAYGDPRRTVIVDSTASNTNVGDLLMPEEATWVTLTVTGKLARSYNDEAPRVTSEAKEPPRFILQSSTAHILYLFTAAGKCATIPVHQLPQVETPESGMAYADLSALSDKDEIISIFSRPPNLEAGYLFLVAENADVKRLRMEDLPGMTANVFTVMNIMDNDRLGWVFPTDGSREIVLTTAQGQAIRFFEDDVRPTGLPSGGMRGIKLADVQDRVVGAFATVEDQWIFSITDDGVAIATPMTEYPSQGRAGSGVIAMRLPKGSNEMAAATIGRLEETVIVLTNKHKAKSMRIGLAPKIKRGRTGGDFVISMNRVNERVVAVVNYQMRIEIPEPIAE